MLDGKTGGDGGAPSSTDLPGGLQLAQAGTGDEPIGVIRAISGQVGLIQISSTPGEIGVGSPVHLNDTVTTGPGGAIEILFVDGTSFSLGADA
ncbi:MAG TPA: hypothetical protein VFE11_01930, partial [Dongiaceae bacterium]|nr:hypothetical protein [Dongiaceae bacterium]